MDNWGLVRIDDRLIHGQVIAVWCRQLKFNRIVILDDGVAKDTFMQQVLRLSAPPGVKIDVFGIADGINNLANEANRANTMLLMKTPQAAKALFDGGLQYKALNIGGIGSNPNRKNIFKNIAISDEEFNILKELHDNGVAITLLTVPGEKSKEFAEFLKS